mgnify:CR=1 FL=1
MAVSRLVASTKDISLVPCPLLAFAPNQRSYVEDCLPSCYLNGFRRIVDHRMLMPSLLTAQRGRLPGRLRARSEPARMRADIPAPRGQLVRAAAALSCRPS